MIGVAHDGRRQPEMEIHPGFSDLQLQLVIALVLSNPGFYAEARQLLKTASFSGFGEAYIGVTISAFDAAWVKAQGPMSIDMVLAELSVLESMSASTMMYSPDVFQRATALVEIVFSTTVEYSLSYEAYARGELSKLLADRLVTADIRTKLQQASVGVLADPQALLRQTQMALDQVQQISSPGIVTGALPVVRPPVVVKRPTGFAPIDQITDGGFQDRQVYGLFGPSGAFKTGTAVQITVGMAQREISRETQGGAAARGTGGLCFYAVYENGADEIHPRAVACATCMPRARADALFGTFNDAMHPTGLTTTPQANIYEREENLRDTEEYRWHGGLATLELFRILDMSGTDVHGRPTHRGAGYVEELASQLRQRQQQEGRPIRLVTIDYAKLLVNRHMSSRGLKPEHLRHYMSRLPDEIRRLIADPFQCSVLILQQMNAKANRMQAGAELSHVDSSEAADFGENMWYCFCISKVDKARENTVKFTASKTRHTAGNAYGTVLRINGNLNKLVETDRWVRDERTGLIIEATAANFAAGNDINAIQREDDRHPHEQPGNALPRTPPAYRPDFN